jgi:CRISPR-associated protein Cmr6
MVVGLGAEGVLETAISLHRTYGVPYIPGSALKGLAAAYAHQRLADARWRKAVYKDNQLVSPIGDAHKVMFGDTTIAGYVTFFDALYVPGSGHKDRQGKAKPLWPDVITVHHPEYYQEQKDDQGNLLPPADWDSPTPISFVSATGAYLIALAGPPAWVEAAYDILALALDEMGVGAKTSSGYGRMTLDGLEAARTRLGRSLSAAPEVDSVQQTGEPAQPRELMNFLERVRISQAGSLPNLMGAWRSLDAAVQRAAATALVQRADELYGSRAGARQWYQELRQFLIAD